MSPRLTLTVVVPTYQRCQPLARLLAALARQTLASDQYEVVVIPDGSTDGTCEMLARFESPYALTWRWQANAGRAAACNAGIALARGTLILLLDDDMEPAPGCLQAHAAEHPHRSRRAVIGAAPIQVTASSPAVVKYVGRKFNRHLERLATPGHHIGLRSFYSGNLSVDHNILVEVGGFDEEFTAYGNEDVELSWRLRAAGVEIAFSPAALAYQYYEKDFRALAGDNVAKGRTAMLLAAKHPAVASHLKLEALDRGASWRWLVLHALVALTRGYPPTLDGVVGLMGAAGRLRPRGLEWLYRLVLDYCFLLGATTASNRQKIDPEVTQG